MLELMREGNELEDPMLMNGVIEWYRGGCGLGDER